MAARQFIWVSLLSVSACALLAPVPARGEEPSSAEFENGQHTFIGEINAANVFVHCRASEDSYATMKLNKGDEVTVVGVKFTWLKIEPPAGSFAYVPKSYINLHGDGKVGRVTREAIAKAGSLLNEMAAQPLATVHEGEEVQIVGEHHEYFKIKPPAGSYLYVNKQFVKPVRVVPNKAIPGPVVADDETPKAPKRFARSQSGNTTQPSEPQVGETGSAVPTTQPSDEVAEAATTQPASTAIADYEKLEQQFKELAQKPVLEQPLPEILAGYQKVLEADDLPPSMRRIAEIRVATLKVRNDARDKFLAAREEQKKMQEKQQALLAEREEIEDRLKKNDIQLYTAVGTLRTSSLQVGQATLYRLTDPATGRTVAYIRTNDPKYGGMLGQFIGVRGTLVNDPQLKSIVENPNKVDPVDPAKVNTSVAAQIVPPSLAPGKRSAQASTGNEQ